MNFNRLNDVRRAVIGDAISSIEDKELAAKLAASAAKGIKKMLEGAGWYQ